MSFALTGFQARGLDVKGPSKKYGVQQAVLTITAATSDVDLDIGDDDGTFWTAALADSTYGGLAAKALEILQKIDGIASLVAVKSQQLLDRVQAAAASGTAYTLAIENQRPNITCDAANGESAWTIILEYELNAGELPVFAHYG